VCKSVCMSVCKSVSTSVVLQWSGSALRSRDELGITHGSSLPALLRAKVSSSWHCEVHYLISHRP